jgi:glycosyltransferase involved in cell wall biosynthesis
MRIGVVTTSYPRWPGDFAGSFVEGHVLALRELGHEVEVIAAGDGDAHDEAAVVRVDSTGLFYQGGAPDVLERSPRSMFGAAAFTTRMTAVIRRRARDWDQIVAHWLVPSALAALPARKPLTAIAHGGDIHTLRRMRMLAPTLRLLRDAKLVFVSEELRALAGATGVVQPMGIDLTHFASLGRAPVSPPTVLVVSRLVPIKGVDVAIEACARLGVRLLIAGDGPQRPAPRGDVTFLGAVDTRRRDELLKQASVVVVPSRRLANGRAEGCPTIALEALAAGVPVVSTIGRATEIVAPDDPHALALAIDRTLARPPRSELCRQLVMDLDWTAVAGRLLRSE